MAFFCPRRFEVTSVLKMSSESETDIDDDIFELACNYKLTGKYPKDCPQNKKRTIRRQAKSIILQNGEMWKE